MFTCNVVENFKILYFHYYSDQVSWQRERSVLAHSPSEYDTSWQRWHGGVSRGSGCAMSSMLHFWHMRRQRGEGKQGSTVALKGCPWWPSLCLVPCPECLTAAPNSANSGADTEPVRDTQWSQHNKSPHNSEEEAPDGRHCFHHVPWAYQILICAGLTDLGFYLLI